MARVPPTKKKWRGDDETVISDPWWKREHRDTLPDLVNPPSHIRDVIRPPRDVEEETTGTMEVASQSELIQACQQTGQEWMVRNGSRTVGPVSTVLLLEGILAERIPTSCEVRRLGSPSWQPLTRAPIFALALAEVADRSR